MLGGDGHRGGDVGGRKKSKRSGVVTEEDGGEMGKSSYSLLSHNQLA